MVKRLFIFLFSLLVLASCSDDEKYSVEPVDGDDGTITFTISIPEQEKVVSRAEKADTPDERKINDLSVLIYNADGNLIQSELGSTAYSVPSGDNSETRITVTLNSDAKSYTGEATIYIIANAKSLLNAGNTATTSLLRGVTSSATVPASSGFLMSGKVTSRLNSAGLLVNAVILYRTEAKITMENEAEGFTLGDTWLYNGADRGYLVAGADKELYAEASILSAKFTEGALYTYPCKNTSGNTFIIINGKYNGIATFYRINLRNDVGYLDISPNHWYEVHISSVTGAGYPTAEEAAANPAGNDIAADIYDHAPAVLDMAFDGIHELGVTDTIRYSGTDSGEAVLTVKYYSKETGDMSTLPVVTASESWISINGPEISDSGDGSTTPGKTAEYRITFHATDELGTLGGLIRTQWHGLWRNTAVIWERTFDGNSISTAQLTIHPTDGSGDKVITDYWEFLSGEGTSVDAAGVSPRLFGIQPGKMGGKVRNEGFHFPVMYGAIGNNRWSYSYKVTMKSIRNSEYDCSLQIFGDNAIKNVTVNPDTGGEYFSFTLSRPGNAGGNDYTYGTGKLILTVTPKNAREASRIASKYEFDLYHTGFFHYDAGNRRIDRHDIGYYYYEVLPVDGATSGDTRYILDRNLGAKAAGMYIQDINGNNYFGSSDSWPFDCGVESAGGYYQVAHDLGTDNYDDPGMYDNVTPPGYSVPMQRIWDAIRNSQKFSSRQSSLGSTTYFEACYNTEVTDNEERRREKIYFPKARFLDNGNQSGDAAAGYYWTATAAVGTEKEEIGRWLKSLQFSGAVTSYINGQVENYAMSVRCINDADDRASYNVISFNVKGATHVFLYKGEVSDKEYTTSWPGHPIGNYATAGQYFNFVYESTLYSASDLKVIFNYVDESGTIHTISKKGNVSLSKAEGWEVSSLINKNVECHRTGGYNQITVN